MHPLTMLSALKDEYTRYVDSFQFYKTPAIQQWVEAKRAEGRLLYREPFLTLAKPFAPGGTLGDLIGDPNGLHPGVAGVFLKKMSEPDLGPVEPFEHQRKAVIHVLAGENTLVTTGTGSGKSFTFHMPIVSAALRARDAAGGKTGFRSPVGVIIYPMNALANSQYEDLALRLKGTGLKICNYTGDLKKTRDDALNNFREVTGRDEPYDSEVIDRGTLHNDGCDILLTNFKMLEYALVRRKDGHLFQILGEGGRLQYLVLDEMHTYSGRQGADMALLVRRFKERTGTQGILVCIGTSATVESGDPAEAAAVIAEFATHLFGEQFDPGCVVQEAYGDKVTRDLDEQTYLAPEPVPAEALSAAKKATSDAEVLAILGAHMLSGVADSDAVRGCRPVAWLERALWGGVRSITDLAQRYVDEVRPGCDLDAAERELEAALMLGSAASETGPKGNPVGLLTPKVHAFFSQGLPVTRCLRSEDPPHLSEQGESSCSTCDREGVHGVSAYPVVFCAACGQDYYVAANSGLNTLISRDFLGDSEGAAPVYVMTDEWDRDEAPVDPSDIKKDGCARKGRQGAVPEQARVCGRCGSLTGTCGHDDEIRDVVMIGAPMMLCPSCGVRYDGNNSEYNKFFQIGAVGRATATDVLVDGMLANLDGDVKPQVIGFTDNQQDSSFQAAHLRSTSRRFHLRRALYASLAGTGPDDEIDAGDVAERALQAMKDTGTLPPFQQQNDDPDVIELDPEAMAGASEGRYARYLKAGLLIEVSGPPRKAQPNLEDTGLVVVDYAGLTPDKVLLILKSGKYDTDFPHLSALAKANPDLAFDLLRVLLDTMRRNRALTSENPQGPAAPFMDAQKFKSDVLDQLNPDAFFHGGPDLPRRPTVYHERVASTRRLSVRRLAGKINADNSEAPHTTTLTRWLRKEDATDTPTAKALIREAAAFLKRTKYLHARSKDHAYVVREQYLRFWRTESPIGYRCPRCASRWLLTTARHCPRCVKTELKEDRPGQNDFFRNQYTLPLGDALRVDAREHTGSLSGDERKTIETNFRDQQKPLNVLVCTPTMELGVDIGSLSAVYMRNVPPSPANYAQRQGRAGRQAQPSTVVTFCSAQGRNGPHDQYFFKRPEKIISGRIAAPRFLLDNEALLTAHINAMILGAREEDLPDNLTGWVDLDVENGGLKPDFRNKLDGFITDNRDTLIARAQTAFHDVLADAQAVQATLPAETVDGFVDGLNLEMAALVAYSRELEQELDNLNALGKVTSLSKTEERRRSAIEYIRQNIREGRGDYYPLAWLSIRGFLPTYAFPRKPVLLRFSNKPYPRVRSQAIALREFAPGNSIYHLGQRYVVSKASLGPDATTITEEFRLCRCGAYLNRTQSSETNHCPTCNTPLSEATPLTTVIPVTDCYAVEQENVGADSEERLRLGYAIDTAYQLPRTGLTNTSLTASGKEPIEATYAHLGTLTRFNRGLVRGDGDGFTLCTHCRTWNPPEDHWNDGKTCHPESEHRLDNIVLYSQGRHDMLLLDLIAPDGDDPDDYAYTLSYALVNAISSVYGIEVDELGSEVFPHPAGDNQPNGRRILLFEMDEGGIGVLNRVSQAADWMRTAAQALDLLHCTPDGADQPNACIDSCYECLRTFHNQWRHSNLDRRLVIDYLLAAATNTEAVTTTHDQEWDDVLAAFSPDKDAKYASRTEQILIERLIREGLPAPTQAHAPRPTDHPITEVDLLYATEGAQIAVFLDGGVHDQPEVAEDDKVKRAKLKDLGYQIVTIRYDEADSGVNNLKKRLGVH